MTNARVIGTTLTAFAIVSAATLLTAPNAAAYITKVEVAPGMGVGYGTGCTYKVTITGDPGDKVYWVEDQVYVNGQWDHAATGVFGAVTEIAGQPGKFTVDWTPKAKGEHYVGAGHNQYREGASVKVTVGTGQNLGSSCIGLP